MDGSDPWAIDLGLVLVGCEVRLPSARDAGGLLAAALDARQTFGWSGFVGFSSEAADP